MRVLITGAAGTIGRDLREGLRGRYELLRLLDVAEQEPARDAAEEIVTANVADGAAMRAAAEGMDAIVHLAAMPTDVPFDVLLEPNIVGTQRVFEAAVAAGVPRVVYASSHHTAGFWPRSHPMRVTDPVRPDSHYGVSKVFGEAVGRLHHDKHGLQVACLRIQSWTAKPTDTRHLASWLSPRDGVELVHRCLVADGLGFAVIWGVSANSRSWLVQEDLGWLGWAPQDDGEAFADEVEPEPPGLSAELDGGPYVARLHDPRYD